MTYNEFIQNIIDTRGQWSEEVRYSGVCQRHHIKPICLGGEKKKNWEHLDNIIWLYFEEHVKAHELLAIENQDNEKLLYAWYKLSNYGKINYNNELYLKAKNIANIKTSNALKGRVRPELRARHYYNNGIIEIRIKDGDLIPETFIKGRLPRSKEWHDKIAIKQKGKIMPKESCELLSKKLKGRKLSNEWKENISKGSMGNTKVRGRKWYTNGDEDKLLFYCPEGWVQGRSKIRK